MAELVEPESMPEPLRQFLVGLVRLLTALSEQSAALDNQILAWHRANPCNRRLSTIDGVGPILSSTLALRVQQPRRFACGRDLSAWIGLATKQNSSGGKVRLQAICKKGDVYLPGRARACQGESAYGCRQSTDTAGQIGRVDGTPILRA